MNPDTRRLVDRVQSEARNARDNYLALSEAEREARGLVEPHVPSNEEVLDQILEAGTRAMTGYRAPNTILGIGPGFKYGNSGKTYRKDDALMLGDVCVPAGSEILALDATEAEGPDWDVVNLCFGMLNLVNAQSSGPVSLEQLTHLTCDDLLSEFKDKRTTCDIPTTVHLVCKRDGATFSGYRLSLYQESQHVRYVTPIHGR